ncbi:MAG: hypothetical protein M1376_00760 [Planctomycetes bacterium]|nr:hypothetical protein [Planctomycetota bacterium]
MTKLLVLVFAAAMAPAAMAKVWVTVYQHDGKTPLAAVDADHPNVFRDIMVGARLTLVVRSDTGEKWGGLLQLSWDDANDARLTGRGLTPPPPGSPIKFSTYKDSALNAAGTAASVRDFLDMYGIGLALGNDAQPYTVTDGHSAYPGDWFIVDYYAEQAGTCNVELYGSSTGSDVLLQTLSFTHVPSRDFNHDARVNFLDFARFASGWRCGADPNSGPTADLDLSADGRVDLADLASFSRSWLEQIDSPIVPVPVKVFDEGWETATAGVYTPGSTISSDAGSWLVEDIISQISGCGLSPQRAEILADNGHHALQLRSVESLSGCGDTVAVSLQDIHGANRELNIPLAPDTTISFNEVGELIDPERYNPGEDRLGRPGFDNVSLLLKDNNRNYLLYVLQRPGGAVPSVMEPKLAPRYREILLDPAAGSYRRNLLADFQTIPGFYAPKAKITLIVFSVDQHGSALLDDLVIGPAAPADAAVSLGSSARP